MLLMLLLLLLLVTLTPRRSQWQMHCNPEGSARDAPPEGWSGTCPAARRHSRKPTSQAGSVRAPRDRQGGTLTQETQHLTPHRGLCNKRASRARWGGPRGKKAASRSGKLEQIPAFFAPRSKRDIRRRNGRRWLKPDDVNHAAV